MFCSKCGNQPQETDKFGWKCTSCGKMYGVKLSYLRTAYKKKISANSSLVKCKECGEPLDNGKEKIIWKCSCGNTQVGKLEDFNLDKIPIKTDEKKELSKKIKKPVLIFSVLITLLIVGTVIGVTVNKHSKSIKDNKNYAAQPTEQTAVQETSHETPENTPDITEIPKSVNTEEDEKSKLLKQIKLKVINKKNFPVDYSVGRYQAYIDMDFKVTNNTNRSIKGIKGELSVYDQFDDLILLIKGWNISGKIIEPHKTIKITNCGIDCNPYDDSAQKLYTTDYDELIFRYEIKQINFVNGDKVKYD